MPPLLPGTANFTQQQASQPSPASTGRHVPVGLKGASLAFPRPAPLLCFQGAPCLRFSFHVGAPLKPPQRSPSPWSVPVCRQHQVGRGVNKGSVEAKPGWGCCFVNWGSRREGGPRARERMAGLGPRHEHWADPKGPLSPIWPGAGAATGPPCHFVGSLGWGEMAVRRA